MKYLKIILSVILLLTYIYLTYLLIDIGLLSTLLGKIIYIILIILLIFIIFGLFKFNKKIKRILYVFYIIVLIICFVTIYYLRTTQKFFMEFKNDKDENYSYYYLFALKDSKYYKLNDLEEKKIGICEEIDSSIIKKFNIKFNKQEYSDCSNMTMNLYNKTIDAVILSDVKEYLISEAFLNFEKKIREIYKVSILKDKKEETNDSKNVKEAFTLYISGIDTSGTISKVSRSDVNIIVTVNPNTYEILLTTIPRDYYVQLHDTTGYKDKLTHAGIYGVGKSINTIEDLLSIDIDYYVRVNFDSLIKLVDEIGGITVYSDQNLNFCNIKKGNNELDGKCALRFSRERKIYSTGDRHRGENQEEVIKSIINKVSKSTVLLTKYNSIMESWKDNFETNVSLDIIKEYIKIQLDKMPEWNVKSLNLNGFDSYNYTYSYYGSQLYVMEPDINTVNRASNAINGILNNKTFNDLEIWKGE